ncbi:MAG TPA: cytochrome c oxidase subunit II [Candidatus Eisenbacteria bacterium]|jgi:cytochrome c oxidase subunit 2
MTARPHRASRSLAALAVALLACLFLGGCTLQEFPQSTLHPQGDVAREIQSLLEQLVFWVAIIFVLVQGALIYAVVRFRARPGAPDPKPVHGNTTLEIAWTIAPAVILALVAVPTVLTIFHTQGKPPANALTVKVIGHQWWWEFQYPEYGVTTGSEMHVPLGRAVGVDIESADVAHSFWLPAMAGKRDALPNHTNHLWFTAESTGVFPGQCAELCGISHANMRMKLVVTTKEEFERWVAVQKSAPAEPEAGSLAATGKETFAQSACIGCHTIQGVSAGIIGPDLTHFGSRTTIAGAMFPNDTEHLAKWITEPDKRKPGTLMLNLGLAPEQVTALVAYLQSLK